MKKIESEIWKPVNYLNLGRSYIISSVGRLKSSKNKNGEGFYFVKPYFNKKRNYYYFNFSENGRAITRSMHRMVAMTFKPIPSNHGLVVDHIDFNTKNNSVDNLQWITQKQNALRSRAAGRFAVCYGEASGMSKIKEDAVYLAHLFYIFGFSKKYIAKILGVAQCTVSLILSGERWPHVFKELYGKKSA